MSLRYFVSRQFHQIAPIGRLDANNFEDASSATLGGTEARRLAVSNGCRLSAVLGSPHETENKVR